VKHVFVETNFLISVLRPFPARGAQRLLERAVAGELRLHVPWVALSEVKRTLTRVMDEDLDFRANMLRYAVQDLQARNVTQGEMQVIQRLADRAKAMHGTALQNIHGNVDALASKVRVINPSEAVVKKTLAVFPIKQLPPFDEMVLGAVLATAEQLHSSGQRELWFCNLNSRDFSPDRNTSSSLGNEYTRCGLTYLPSFDVP
jgi:predicted nucleic acid-binding protein